MNRYGRFNYQKQQSAVQSRMQARMDEAASSHDAAPDRGTPQPVYRNRTTEFNKGRISIDYTNPDFEKPGA